MRLLLLAGNTSRSRAYAHTLGSIPGIEVHGLFYGFEERKMTNPDLDEQTKHNLEKINLNIVDLSIPLPDTFEMNNWTYEHASTSDVNSESIVNRIHILQPDFVIFSGYGGQILRKEHFETGIHYLHMHPGSLPEERGSTTIYYSILNQKKCTVTAFFMTPKIDSGQIVVKKEYDIPRGKTNMDIWYDACVRADCLREAVLALLMDKTLATDWPPFEDSEEYYIIHPVLKHIALLSLESAKDGSN